MTDIYERLKNAHSENAVGACEAALQSLWARDEEIERLRGVVKTLIDGPPERLKVNGRPETLDWFERLIAAGREALGERDA